MHPLAELSDECRLLLQDQHVSSGGPGTILADIETLLAFVGERALVTKSKQGNLPAEVLPELNTLLAAPIEMHLNRPLLRDYPNIAGLYVLARVMDLVRVEEGNRLRIAPDLLAAWHDLNSTEQYFALFEAWLLRGDGQVLGAEVRGGRRQFSDNLTFLTDCRGNQWRSVGEYFHHDVFGGGIPAWNVQLQARFGLVELDPLPVGNRIGKTRGWMLRRARRTARGTAVTWALLEMIAKKEEDNDRIFFNPPDDAGFGYLQPTFRPYFPEWEKVYGLAPAPASTGRYVFKVSLAGRERGGGVWRRLAVPAGDTLDDLSFAVLDAFGFTDTDHLYEFRYRDHLGRGRVYNHPYTDDGPYASEITVGKSGLPEKGTMTFKFDFGDCWKFELRLERIEEERKDAREIELIDSGGTAPPQYPDYDE